METVIEKKPFQNKNKDESKLELYRLIGEGYKAMQDGRAAPIEEVKERIQKRRKDRD